MMIGTACAPSGDVAPTDTPREGTMAQRIVSLDYCADQYVLALADPGHILALSPDAAKPFSYLRDTAHGIRTIRPVAEDIILAQPDLVVRSYGGGPRALPFFEKAGIGVVQLGWVDDVAGTKAQIRDIAQALGAPERGQALIALMDARLAALPPPPAQRPTLLYLASSGYTTGPGSFVHQMMQMAGHKNFETRAGWHPISLEQFVYAAPDRVMQSAFTGAGGTINRWSVLNHPVARNRLVPDVIIDGAATTCAAWFTVDVVEAMAALHHGGPA